MRRKDREIQDFDSKITVLQESKVCSVAFMDKTYPYVVPLNYGFSVEGEQLYLYFHGADVGKKLEVVAQNPHVGFNIIAQFQISRKEKACKYGAYYQSLCGNGVMEIVEDIAEKKIALGHIASKYARKCNQDLDPNLVNVEFSDDEVKNVGVLRLKVDEFKGKQLLKS